jgi:hypothetical protein
MRAISCKSTAINVHTWPAKMTEMSMRTQLGAPVYDVSASTFGKSPQKFSLESAAADLFRLVKLVRRKTGAPRIFLVPTRWAGSSSDAWCSESFPTTRTPAGTLAPGPTSSSGFRLRHPTRRHRVRGRWWLAGDVPRPHRGPGRRHLRYGMVSSEEGYQNLRRFLFGNLRVQVELVGLDVQGREDDYHLATGDVPGDPRSARSRARVLHRPSRTKRGLAKYPSQLRFRSP